MVIKKLKKCCPLVEEITFCRKIPQKLKCHLLKPQKPHAGAIVTFNYTHYIKRYIQWYTYFHYRNKSLVSEVNLRVLHTFNSLLIF